MLEIKPILSALTRHKSATALIVLQIAITFAVVVNSISIINQRLELMNRESGLAEEEILAFNINPFGEDYDIEYNYKADIELLRSIPGVIDAVITNMIPISQSGSSSGVSGSQQDVDDKKSYPAGFFRGDDHILNTLGVKLSAGRNFTGDEIIYSEEFVNPNVVLITQPLADKLYTGGEALGKQIYFWGIDATVVGIIETLAGPWPDSSQFMDNLIQPVIALNRFVRIIVRVESSEMNTILGNVEKKLIERNPNRVITSVRSLEEIKKRSYSNDYAMTQILWTVITLLILITALGIVGIVSFNVNQRTKQIGIKRALGATKMDIIRYFITENIMITAFGITIGAIITILFNNYLVSAFKLTAVDWIYIPIGAAIMLLTGVLSVWAPARKASLVSPAVATQTI